MLSLVFAGSHGKAVRDGLLCPQIHTDPHRLEALAKPCKFGRGSVPAARDSSPYGQRGRCPSRVAKFCAKLTGRRFAAHPHAERLARA